MVADASEKFIEHGIVSVPMGINGTANVTYFITQDKKDKDYTAKIFYRGNIREEFSANRNVLNARIIQRATSWASNDRVRRDEARFLTGIVERVLRKWSNED